MKTILFLSCICILPFPVKILILYHVHYNGRFNIGMVPTCPESPGNVLFLSLKNVPEFTKYPDVLEIHINIVFKDWKVSKCI